MTDGGLVPRNPADLAGQMREAAERLMKGWTAAAGSMPGAATGRPAAPGLPTLPASMSAEQVQKVLDDLVARRAQVQALRDSLTAFDEQLEGLEAGIRPVLEWTRMWADLEKSIADFTRLPGSAP